MVILTSGKRVRYASTSMKGQTHRQVRGAKPRVMGDSRAAEWRRGFFVCSFDSGTSVDQDVTSPSTKAILPTFTSKAPVLDSDVVQGAPKG